MKKDHVGLLLKEAMTEIKHVLEELPEKEKVNEEYAAALKSETLKLNTVKENRDTLTKKGIKLMTALQKNKDTKKKNEAAQNKVQAKFNQAKCKSTGSQEEVDHLNKKLNSAQKAQLTLASGKMQIAELNAKAKASGKQWMTNNVIQAGNTALIVDLNDDAVVDDTYWGGDLKAKEYPTKVMKAKLIMEKLL